MAHLVAHHGRYYARVKVREPDGTEKWRWIPTDHRIGQPGAEAKARRDLGLLQERLDAGEKFGALKPGQITVAGYCHEWVKARERNVIDWKKDESRLRHYVLPTLGKELIHNVRAPAIADLVMIWRGRVAPRTVRNCYSVLSAMFRDAEIAGIIDRSPCILTKRQLGSIKDKDPLWRATALFKRPELEALISDARIPFDRQVYYALQGLAGLRNGEACGLRWKHLDAA